MGRILDELTKKLNMSGIHPLRQLGRAVGVYSPTNKKKEEPELDMNEPEDEDEGKDYEEMTAKQLYNLCEERGIECKPRKAKEYYIDLLEEADEEDSDDWGEDEEDEGDDW